MNDNQNIRASGSTQMTCTMCTVEGDFFFSKISVNGFRIYYNICVENILNTYTQRQRVRIRVTHAPIAFMIVFRVFPFISRPISSERFPRRLPAS